MTLRVGDDTSTYNPTNANFNPNYQQSTGYTMIWKGKDTQLVESIKTNKVPQLVDAKTTVEYQSNKWWGSKCY